MTAAEALGHTLPSEAGGNAPSTISIGSEFPAPHWDRYEFLEVLGRGGMGSVYRARDRRLGRPVALKFIHGQDPGLIQRFLQEARAQARLDHPHICKVYEVGSVDGKPYIAMELVEGQTLDRACARLSLSEKLQLVKDAAEALHAAHEEGIVHRDIKPSNIMVERRPGGGLRPLIMDFGLARESGGDQNLTESGAVMGTPAYMSPEQARGEARHLDRRSDVYSLGATLYDVLVGKPPFQDQTVVNILIKVMNEAPLPLRAHSTAIPEPVELIVSKCLNKEPAQRYPTALALAEDIGRYLRAQSVMARRLSYSYRLLYWARHNRTLAGISAALVFSILTLTGYGISTRIAAIQKDRKAKEQAELLRWLGQSVKDLEWVARTSYLLPLHDTSNEKRIIKERMEEIEAALRKNTEVSGRMGAYARGRGYLALHDWKRAYEELHAAELLGHKDPELDYALGRALGALYSQALDDARKSGDKSFFEKRKRELDEELLKPTLGYLDKSRALKTISVDYIEGLIAFFQEKQDDALKHAEAAHQQTPWLYEAVQLGGDVFLARARTQLDRGEHDAAEASFKEAVARYERAAEIGRSDHLVHEAVAEAFIRWEELSRYSGKDPEPQLKQALVAADRALQASPTESHGHTKKGYAYFFQGDYVQQHNSKSASASWREQQLAEGKKSIAQNSNDAYGHDITGIALFRLAEINAENKKPSQKLLDGAYDHFEAALKINPSFPWAYNDFAIALLVEAQDKSQHNQNPLQAIEKVIETAKKAITADESYIYAYNTITLAAMTISAWQVEHGINPSHYVEIGRNAAQRSIALNNKYTPAIGNLGNLYMILSFYDFISGNKIDEHYELAIKHFRSISDIDKNDLIPYISIPIVRYFEAGAKLDGDGDPAPAIEAGLELAAQGLKLAPDEPYCLEIQSRLHGAKALWLKKQGRPHLAELELASRLSKQALVKIPEEQDALLGGAEIAYQLADAQLGRGKRPATIVQEGLTAVERALASAAGTPRALALRGALLSLRGKLEPNRKQKQATLQAAQTAFAESFAGNPLLRRRYEGIQREVEELLAGL